MNSKVINYRGKYYNIEEEDLCRLMEDITIEDVAFIFKTFPNLESLRFQNITNIADKCCIEWLILERRRVCAKCHKIIEGEAYQESTSSREYCRECAEELHLEKCIECRQIQRTTQIYSVTYI